MEATENTSGRAVINGVELQYEVRGNGSHPILCIPGALGTIKVCYQPQLEYFGRQGSGYKVVSFDPRGYGASRPANRFCQGQNFFLQDALDAVGLMQHLSLHSYSVFGWCNGGIAALFLAARHGDNVKKLIIWGANAFTTPEFFDSYEKTRDLSQWKPRLLQPLLEVYGESFQSMWSEWLDSFKETFGKNDGDICKEELCNIRCPTLIVHGARDPLLSSLHPEYIHKHISGSQLFVMEKGTHDPHLKYSDEFNEKVEEYLN